MTANPVPSEHLSVLLIAPAGDGLRQLQEVTNLSRTDLANRAILLYTFFDAQERTGHDMITRDRATGKTRLVQLTDAPAGQAATAGPAFARRGPAGRERRSGRHRRLHLTGRRSARLLPLLADLSGPEGSTS